MKNARLIVETKVNGQSRKGLWETERKFQLGLSLPWMLVRNEAGIRLRHNSGQAWDVAPEAVDQKMEIELPNIAKDGKLVAESGSGIAIKLEHAKVLPALYDRHDSTPIEWGSGRWVVYDCSGPG